MISVSLNIEILVDSTVTAPVDRDAIAQAVRLTAFSRRFTDGEIGVRVTDDQAIHEINRLHLNHDYPTDVISFEYQCDLPNIEGELVVSIDTADRRASELGWKTSNELLLYIVHGVLHLTRMDDQSPEERSEMRNAEAAILTQLGVADIVRYGADVDLPADAEKQS